MKARISRGRRFAAAAVAVALVAAAVASVLVLARRSSEPPTTAELIRTLIEEPDAAERGEAATLLVAERDCSIAREVAQLGSRGRQARERGLLLKDRYVALYRNGGPRGRTTAVRCVAAFDDAESAALVVSALGDRAPPVREAAVQAVPILDDVQALVPNLITRGIRSEGAEAKAISRALAGIGAPAVQPLVARVADGQWVAETLVLIGRPAAAPLRAAFRRGRGGRQTAAALALLQLRGVAPDLVRASTREIVSEMMERLGRSTDPDFAAAEVLAAVGRPAVPRLVRLARTPHLELSRPEQNMRSSAVLVLTEIGAKDGRAVAALLAALRRKDYDYVADLHMFYIQFGLGERELIDALQAHGDTEILLDFLTSGNRRLEQAAREYARRNGYTITGDPRTTGLYGSWNKARLGKG